MSIIAWNCRGLGSDATVGELRYLVMKFRPALLFLSETKMWDKKAKGFMWSLGYIGSFAVRCECRSGGLVLFWKQPYSVSLGGFNSHCIDVTVKTDDAAPWFATFVYGEPRREHRHIFWDLLCRLGQNRRDAWICCGDFNEVLCHDEHYGVRDRSDAQIEMFRGCMDACSLSDMGFSGSKFIWCNRQDAQSNVRVHLDRAVCNADFATRFADCHVENVITTSSDHSALVIDFVANASRYEQCQVQRPFQYEAAWRRADDYRATVEEVWADRQCGPNPLQTTWSTMVQMAGSLQTWSREVFGSVRKKIRQLEKKLRQLRELVISPEVLAEERATEQQLCELFEREEIMARQRSRVDWLREGDRNTTFFHARASARKKTNRIDILVREDGSKCEDQQGIKGMVHSFYEDLFTLDPFLSMDEVLDAIPVKVDDTMNASLCEQYSNDEIKEAL
jgi:hypothetical protein